jgi:hypothetical protein
MAVTVESLIHDFKQNDFHEAASVLLAILPPHS